MAKFSPTKSKNVTNARVLEDVSTIAFGHEILVLNATYEVINVTSWKRAILLLVKEKAIALSSRVIRLLEYVYVPVSKLSQAKPSRSMVYRRDGNRCQYCGSTRNLTIDHVLPRSRGGGDEWTNMVAACSPCNTKKGDRTPEEVGMKLLKKPVAPMSKVIFIVAQSQNPEWQQYNYQFN